VLRLYRERDQPAVTCGKPVCCLLQLASSSQVAVPFEAIKKSVKTAYGFPEPSSIEAVLLSLKPVVRALYQNEREEE
jgi:hypothetical protein